MINMTVFIIVTFVIFSPISFNLFNNLVLKFNVVSLDAKSLHIRVTPYDAGRILKGVLSSNR